jgi:hypothetical protein
MMDNGSIVENGSYDQLIKQNGVFSNFIKNYYTNKDDDEEDDYENQEKETPQGKKREQSSVSKT